MSLDPEFTTCGVDACDLKAVASHFSSFAAFPSLASQMNQNLNAAQKELLLWHWKLCHIGFDQMQMLFRAACVGDDDNPALLFMPE